MSGSFRSLLNEPLTLVDALSRLYQLRAAGHENPNFRQSILLERNGRFLPHPLDVEDLLSVLFQRLDGLWKESPGWMSDLRIAALALFGVANIGPFEAHNEAVALDFAQYLLCKRWNKTEPPLKFDPALLGELLRLLDEPYFGKTPQVLTARYFHDQAHSLTQTLSKMDLWSLMSDAHFTVAARLLSGHLDTAQGGRA